MSDSVRLTTALVAGGFVLGLTAGNTASWLINLAMGLIPAALTGAGVWLLWGEARWVRNRWGRA